MPSNIPRSFDSKNMEQNVAQKPPSMNVKIPELGMDVKIQELDINDLKKNSQMLGSPKIGSPKIGSPKNSQMLGSPTSKSSQMLLSPTSQAPGPRKSSSGRWNCLCSPTTHAGSFRCRYHRSSGMHRGRSVGSNLSELGGKAGTITELSSLGCK